MPEIVIKVREEGIQATKERIRSISYEARKLGNDIRDIGRTISALATSGFAITSIAEKFGILRKEQAAAAKEMTSYVALTGTLISAIGRLTKETNILSLAEKARGAAHAFANTMASGLSSIASGIIGVLRSIASSSILVAIAEKARALAHAVANAVASFGVAVPIIIAASAAAVAGVLAATGSIPGLAQGGLVKSPTLALLAEREPEVITPLSRLNAMQTTNSITINVYESESPTRTAEKIVSELQRKGVI